MLLPDAERPFNPSREPRRILAQAKDISPAAERLCSALFETEGRVGQRLWGIVNLARKYPASIVEAACETALHDGVRSYKHAKHLSELGFDEAVAAFNTPTESTLTHQHSLIRNVGDYADLFNRGAQFSADITTHQDHKS